MFCSQCGKEIEEGSKFCENCGNPIERKPKEETTQSQKGQDINHALVITEKESLEGTEKTILLHKENNEVDKITINIPSGIKSGGVLRILGKGHPGLNGGENGDLYIKIRYDTKTNNSQEDAGKSDYSADDTSRYTTTDGNKVKKDLKIFITVITMIFIVLVLIDVYKNKETSPGTDISSSFRVNVKGGWKFLAWGMGVNEVNDLLVKNGMEELKYGEFSDKDYIRYGVYDPNTLLAKCGLSRMINDDKNIFRFYFIDEKLMAVSVHYDVADTKKVIDQLKNKYPNGKMYSETQMDGARTEHGEHFMYVDNNIIIHNEAQINNTYPQIWYVNPEVIKIKSDMERLKQQTEERESGDRVKKLFQ